MHETVFVAFDPAERLVRLFTESGEKINTQYWRDRFNRLASESEKAAEPSLPPWEAVEWKEATWLVSPPFASAENHETRLSFPPANPMVGRHITAYSIVGKKKIKRERVCIITDPRTSALGIYAHWDTTVRLGLEEARRLQLIRDSWIVNISSAAACRTGGIFTPEGESILTRLGQFGIDRQISMLPTGDAPLLHRFMKRLIPFVRNISDVKPADYVGLLDVPMTACVVVYLCVIGEIDPKIFRRGDHLDPLQRGWFYLERIVEQARKVHLNIPMKPGRISVNAYRSPSFWEDKFERIVKEAEKVIYPDGKERMDARNARNGIQYHDDVPIQRAIFAVKRSIPAVKSSYQNRRLTTLGIKAKGFDRFVSWSDWKDGMSEEHRKRYDREVSRYLFFNDEFYRDAPTVFIRDNPDSFFGIDMFSSTVFSRSNRCPIRHPETFAEVSAFRRLCLKEKATRERNREMVNQLTRIRGEITTREIKIARPYTDD